jgi:hypothetical protein
MSSAPNPAVTITFDQLKELIKEIKKPSAEEAERIEKEKALKLRAQREKVEQARIEMAEKKRREDSCPHRKPNGETTVMGQRHSDGMVHPICFRCQKEFPPRKARSEEDIISD